MKILLLGKNGQVGYELQRTLLPLGTLVLPGRNEADLSDLSKLGKLLDACAPDVIVNAAAYTAVDQAEADAVNAYRVNAEALGVLAAYAYRRKALLVHYSTDYVFDGTKSDAYLETDAANPLGVYGDSKHRGEELVLQSGCDTLIFRTSWVVSARRSNFIKTILRLANERDQLDVVADQHGAPTSAELIADVSALAIACFRKQALSKGIYHLTAAGTTNWHGLARHVVERSTNNGHKLTLKSKNIRAIATEAYPTPAARPKNSRLNTTALSEALGLQLPTWETHVDRIIDELTLGNTSA